MQRDDVRVPRHLVHRLHLIQHSLPAEVRLALGQHLQAQARGAYEAPSAQATAGSRATHLACVRGA